MRILLYQCFRKLSAEVANFPAGPVSTVTASKLEATIELDLTMRGPELLELLSECVGAQVRQCQGSLATECERVIGDCVVTETRHILEKVRRASPQCTVGPFR